MLTPLYVYIGMITSLPAMHPQQGMPPTSQYAAHPGSMPPPQGAPLGMYTPVASAQQGQPGPPTQGMYGHRPQLGNPVMPPPQQQQQMDSQLISFD